MVKKFMTFVAAAVIVLGMVATDAVAAKKTWNDGAYQMVTEQLRFNTATTNNDTLISATAGALDTVTSASFGTVSAATAASVYLQAIGLNSGGGAADTIFVDRGVANGNETVGEWTRVDTLSGAFNGTVAQYSLINLISGTPLVTHVDKVQLRFIYKGAGTSDSSTVQGTVFSAKLRN